MVTLSIIKRVAVAVFNALKPTLRTHIIGQVVSYDAATNTAVVQPVLKIIRGTDANNTTTIQSAPLADVPVRQVGSGKVWCTVAPAVGSYGELHIADRAIDGWLSSGGIVEPTAPRTHDISDAVFEPSLTHLVDEGDNGKFSVGIATDRISLRTRSGDTEISVLDDETVEVNVNGGKATVSIDTSGNVSVESQGEVSVAADGDVTLEQNSGESLTVGSSSVDAGAGSDFVAMATKVDTLWTTLYTLLSTWTPVPMDGGAAFKAASIAAFPSPPASVASGNLKAE